MTQVRRPPVNLSEWKQQVEDDPSIHFDFDNDTECRLKVTSAAFKSGSEISSTEYLHLNIIWHKYAKLDSLGALMKDDPEVSYAGYVSIENMEKATRIFNSHRNEWQNYFNELEERAAEQHRMERRHNHVKPSMGPDYFRSALQFQLLARTTTHKKLPWIAAEEIERTSAITKPGPGSSAAAAPTTINQPVSPSPHKLSSQSVQYKDNPPNMNTPQTKSFLPAKGGKHNKPAFDECYVNNALVEFLQSITQAAGEFSCLDWLGGRVGFKLVECTDCTEDSETEEFGEGPTMKKLMEARVDGYLCRRSNPFEKNLNTDALAILEVKPFTLISALSSIRRQEGAEMACWISEEEQDSTTGLLQRSTSGKKRRWMVTQHRHEIYVIVAEYGVGYEAHIRPAMAITKDSTREPTKNDDESSRSSSTSTSSTQEGSSVMDAPATPRRRNPKLLAGSPSYLKRVEKMGIKVSADGSLQKPKTQPTGPRTGMSEWAGEDDGRVPDVKDFLIMHEFGPFITMDALHMEVFSKRVIAFMLQLSQPQDRSVPDRTDSDTSSSSLSDQS